MSLTAVFWVFFALTLVLALFGARRSDAKWLIVVALAVFAVAGLI